MNRLFAPWRMEYIRHIDDGDSRCFLCAALKSDDDKKHLVLWRGERVFVMLNKFPYVGGHLLIAPNRHGGDFQALEPETLGEMMRATQAAVGILEREMKAHGATVGINIGRPAGAGVPDHIHIHVVPRWKGDMNCMAVLADVRVISEALAATWKRLRPEFRKLTASPRKTRKRQAH
jgi:ATP adenylyltransferase